MSTDGKEPALTMEDVRNHVVTFDEKPKAEARPDEETKKLEAPAKPKKEEPLPPDLPENVKRTQKLIESIHQRREERARLVAEKLRRGVEIENELRQASKDRDERLAGAAVLHKADIEQARKLLDFRCGVIEGAFDDLGHQRAGEINVRDVAISKLDKSLEQLCKQLDAELGKMGAKVTA